MINFYEDFVPLAENIKKMNLKRQIAQDLKEFYSNYHNLLISRIHDAIENNSNWQKSLTVKDLLVQIKFHQANLRLQIHSQGKSFWSIFNTEERKRQAMLDFAAAQLKEAAYSLRRFEGTNPYSDYDNFLFKIAHQG
jgi:hypothetical protein